jgi:hypothetical protein
MSSEVVLKFGANTPMTVEAISAAIWEVCGIEVAPESIRAVLPKDNTTCGRASIFFIPITSKALAEFFTRNLTERGFPTMKWEENKSARTAPGRRLLPATITFQLP